MYSILTYFYLFILFSLILEVVVTLQILTHFLSPERLPMLGK